MKIIWILSLILIITEVNADGTNGIDLDDCGRYKTCYRIPFDCEEAVNCSAVVTWKKKDDNYIEFEMFEREYSYIAIGLSKDKNMGKDSVLACLKATNENDRIQLLYNTAKNVQPKDLTNTVGKYTLKDQSANITDGAVTCKFLRKITSNDSEVFDIDDAKYYAIFARGPISNNKIQKHDKHYIVKNRKMDFMSVYPINNGKVKTSGYVKGHGCLMAIAWMLFAPIGIFTARYLRTFFKEEKDPDEAWFFIHWACMATTVVLTIIAFVLIFVENGSYKPLDDYPHAAHAPLGVFIFVVCLLNPLGGILRPRDPDSSLRTIFNWVHRLLGIMAAILSLVQVMIGLDLPMANSGSTTVKWWVLAMLIINTIYGIILDLVNCGESNDNKEGPVELDSPIAKDQKKPENTSGDPDESTKEGRDAKRYKTRQGILAAIITSGIGLTIRVLVAVGTD